MREITQKTSPRRVNGQPGNCRKRDAAKCAADGGARRIMDYIRRYYGVPAKRFGRVKFQGKPGTITGSDGAYLRVRLDGQKRVGKYHPTWEIEYL